jgi:hypothetical protein
VINSIDDWDRHGGEVPVNKGIVTEEERTPLLFVLIKGIKENRDKERCLQFYDIIEKENV